MIEIRNKVQLQFLASPEYTVREESTVPTANLAWKNKQKQINIKCGSKQCF